MERTVQVQMPLAEENTCKVRRRPKYSIIKNSRSPQSSRVYDQVNLYGCTIGKNTKIDAFVYLKKVSQ